ncbi:hypothetical protein QYF36_004828 [Acer negundo]|nr:hypothetical protein QYF36_004828 [Acer negundo]
MEPLSYGKYPASMRGLPSVKGSLLVLGYGVNVKSYFAWSLLDNMEWNSGYTVRFDIYFIDNEDGGLKRYPKHSALWFKNFV